MRLLIQRDSAPPVEQWFDGDAIVIGPAAGSDVVLGDPAISSCHAEIRRDGPRWVLVDCGSPCGTLVNGRPVTQAAALQPGDVITLASGTRVVFEPGARTTGELPQRTHAVPLGTVHDAVQAVQGVRALGESRSFRALLDVVARVAPSSASVLVMGETGSGKEVVARLLHGGSPRASRALVVVNCPAIPATLLEAELFGVERGVATGVEPRTGLLEAAHEGTLLLDEVADMEPAAQAKLLRFLEDRTVTKVGGRVARRLDVRVVATTNHDLAADVEHGAFRRDLYHRLNVVQIDVPPLRARPEDIPLLVAGFLEEAEGGAGSIDPAALAMLQECRFPGNVRELKHVVEGALALAGGGRIGPEHLPARLGRGAGAPTPASGTADQLFHRIVVEGESFWDCVRRPFMQRDLAAEDVRRLVARAHAEAGGSYRKMARLFRIEPELKKLLNFIYGHDLQVRR